MSRSVSLSLSVKGEKRGVLWKKKHDASRRYESRWSSITKGMHVSLCLSLSLSRERRKLYCGRRSMMLRIGTNLAGPASQKECTSRSLSLSVCQGREESCIVEEEA